MSSKTQLKYYINQKEVYIKQLEAGNKALNARIGEVIIQRDNIEKERKELLMKLKEFGKPHKWWKFWK